MLEKSQIIAMGEILIKFASVGWGEGGVNAYL